MDSSSDDDETILKNGNLDIIELDEKHNRSFYNKNMGRDKDRDKDEAERRDQNIFVSPCANQFNSRGALPNKPKPAKKSGGDKGQRTWGGSRGGRKKERCSAGRNCRFKHEYQHGLEFFHSDDEGPDTAEKRPRTFVPFGGTGMRLGR